VLQLASRRIAACAHAHVRCLPQAAVDAFATQDSPMMAALIGVPSALSTRIGVGSVECRKVANSVLLEAQGRVTRVAMLTQLEPFKALLDRTRAPSWIIDTAHLTDFEPGAVSVGADYFKHFKQVGGVKVVFVSGLATARLAAFTIAFAAHLSLVSAQSLSEAYQILGIEPAAGDDDGAEPHSSGAFLKY